MWINTVAKYSCNSCNSCSIKYFACYMLNTNYPNMANVDKYRCKVFV